MADQYHPTPSPFMGADTVWTANNRAPSPDYIFWNQLSWLVSNYGTGLGKTSFTDVEFDVHNTVSTSNKVTLKFDLDPSISGDTGIVTKYLTVPKLATEPPVPYKDEIVTKYATQTLYNKSFVGAVFRTNANVGVFTGSPYIQLTADDSFILNSSYGVQTYTGVVLPKASTVGSEYRVFNLSSRYAKVAPFLGDVFAADSADSSALPNPASNVYATSPGTSVNTLMIPPYSSRTFICTVVGTVKDNSPRLNNLADFMLPNQVDPTYSTRGNILIQASTGAIKQPAYTLVNSAGGTGAGDAIVDARNFKLNNTSGNGSARFDTSGLTTAHVYTLPTATGSADTIVLNNNTVTLANKTLNSSCQVQASSINGVVAIANGGTGLSTIGSNGQALVSNGVSLSYQTVAIQNKPYDVYPGTLSGSGVTRDWAGVPGGTSSAAAVTLSAGVTILQTSAGAGTNYFRLPAGIAGQSIKVYNGRQSGTGADALIYPPTGGGLDQKVNDTVALAVWKEYICIEPNLWGQIAGGTVS